MEGMPKEAHFSHVVVHAQRRAAYGLVLATTDILKAWHRR